MAKQRYRKPPMSQINVVPYIDVMLVLLVIFMITAPLLTQGVHVDLPRASSEPIPVAEQEPIVVSVDRGGNYYLNVGSSPDQPLSEPILVRQVAQVLQDHPATQVLVKGDARVSYGRVVEVMALLQSAGVSGVGLVTKSPLVSDEGRP